MRISAANSSEQYRALREGAGIVDRSHRGRLLLTGTDRRSYLQGLLTNDIAALAAGMGCYAAYLTAQGRMISDMRVFELGDAILIDLEGFVAPAVRDRLSQFIFSEDVEVRDITEDKAQTGIYGPAAAEALAKALAAGREAGEVTADAGVLAAMATHASSQRAFSSGPVCVLRSDDIGVSGYDVVLDRNLRGAFVEQLRAAGALDVGDETVETTRIEAGRPRFGVDMTEDTIPLEAGIEDRAISRTKGCYVGQEIIIRVLDRGHGRVARRLVGLKLESDRAALRGSAVRAGDREIGYVTSSSWSPSLGTAVALGYVHRDFTEPGTAVMVGNDRATVTSTPFV